MRGQEISMIFQDPLTSLNPIMRVGDQIADTIIVHEGVEKEQAQKKAVEMLSLVGIPNSKERARNYPFELSGGLRQRCMIAIALACDPALLIADEPTTNLDVTIQAQILNLIDDLRQRIGTTLLLITHNLGLIAWLTTKVCVMYAGRIVEQGSTKKIFSEPKHPYTKALLRTIPRIDQRTDKLQVIDGYVPDLINMPSYCYFYPRCSKAKEACKKQHPTLTEIEGGHFVSCLLA